MDRLDSAVKGVAQLLEVTSIKDVREARPTFYQPFYERFGRFDTWTLDALYASRQSVRQGIWAALVERAYNLGTEAAYNHLKKEGTLVPPRGSLFDIRLGDYGDVPPTTARMLYAGHLWVAGGLQEVFDRARAGEMPEAALCTQAKDEQVEYLWVRNRWTVESTKIHARRLRHHGDRWPSDFNALFKQSFLLNNAVVMGVMLDHGRCHHQVAPTADEKFRLALEQHHLLKNIVSLPRSASGPIIDAFEFETTRYARWESGVYDSQTYLHVPHQRSKCPTFHAGLANGPIDRTSFCTVSLPIVKPEDFAVHPRAFMEALGMPVGPSEQLLSVQLPLVMGSAIVRDTAWLNWPA